jgi:cytochrome c oxidase subunit 2
VGAAVSVVPSRAAEPVICSTSGTPLPVVPPHMFEPAGPVSDEVQSMAWLLGGICLGIFVVVEGLLVYSIVRFRRRESDLGEPVQLFGSNPIELAWTVVPTLIVFTLALVTIRVIRDIDRTTPPEGAMHVTAIGHQWWWEYRYAHPDDPAGQVVVANEMHVPLGVPVWLRLESADVIHSWWVPALAGKTDLMPNQTNHLWFRADDPGVYLGQCAEYCGNQHAGMLLRVVAQPEAEYRAWLAAQAAPAVRDAKVAAGRAIFQALACSTCHAVQGVSDGAFAPDLTHLMSRSTIASGMAELDRDTLRAWIDDPQVLKPGCNMPSLKLSPGELDAVTDYLLTLK